MAILIGDLLVDPREGSEKRLGTVIEVIRNPACLMRTLVIEWHDPIAVIEELPELEFGPLED